MEELAAPYLKDYIIDGYDLNRPWGAFYYINNKNLKQFIYDYFNISNLLDISDNNLNLSPKILIVKPNEKLSWQYHLRRKEIWAVLKGPVGIVRSFNNDQNDICIFNKGDIITLDKEERHRLIGLDNYAVVSELWYHTDINNLSDENDIIRIQDDYSRK